jgi:hypothetical protein
MPLMGAQGPGSNISWRGNLDEYPDFFGFVDNIDQWPGIAVTSNSQTITSINYKALVKAVESSSNGIGCSVSVNGADYVDANDPNNPVIIRNNDTVQFQIRTIENQDRFDYNRSYNIDVTIGKRGPESWLVRTRELDDDPVPFFFTDLNGLEVSVGRTSNEVQVQDIDAFIGVDTLITTSGNLYVNGVNVGNSARVLNNDYIYLENTSSGFYSTTVPTTISLGSYTTTWNISTRPADSTVNAFVFTPINDVDPETVHESNSITLSGADPNVNDNNLLNTTVLGGEFKVVRDGVLERDYSSASFNCQNGDVITLRGTASPLYSTDKNVTLNVNGVIGTYVIRTRPTPIKTIPSPFSFRDVSGVERTNTLTPPENRIDSEPITLTGMTTAPDDFGTASITGNGGDGSRAQFKVVRNGQTIRDFGIDNVQVRNGDQIYLRIISSPNSLGQVTATFTVSGTNTFDVIAGVPGSISDTWFVTSAERFCNITAFTFAEETNADPGKEYTRTFKAEGFDKDCGCTVTSSDTANSYFKVNGVKKGASTNVLLGDTVEIVMICPYFDQTRSTTVTLASSYSTQRQAVFKITPKAPPLPELTLDVDPRSVPFIFPGGGNSTIRYSYNYVTNATVTTDFGLSTVPVNTLTSGVLNGSQAVTNVPETRTYTMTVRNSTGSTTKTVELIVGDPPTPTASLCPSNTSTCSNTSRIAYDGSVTLFWQTQFATSITSSDFNTGNQQNGSVTFNNLRQDNRTYTITATGPGGTASASHTIDLTPSVSITADTTNLRNGDSTTLRWSSNLATSVVSSSGFDSGGQVSGTLTINPNTTTTYSITVSDSEGNQISNSVRVTVFDDTTVNGFSFNPDTFTNQNRGSTTCSTPTFEGTGSQVGGLSPGVTVTATVTGGQFASGGTSKQVQNGTPTSELRVCVTNSNNFNTNTCATLNINGVRDEFCSRTLNCTVENGTSTINAGGQSATLNTRRAQGCVNEQAVIGVTGGAGNLNRGGAGSASQEFGPGNFNVTFPAGTNRVYAAVIGAGGGGGTDQGCASDASGGAGGGGAGWGEITGNFGGVQASIRVGNGGAGSNNARGGKGENTVVTVGQTTWRGEGGQGSNDDTGAGGNDNSGPGGTARGGNGSNTGGDKQRRGGGGGGAGIVGSSPARSAGSGGLGCSNTSFASGGQGGTGGSISGGSGSAGDQGECNNSCGSRGGNGGNFGGGGGGGANGTRGGNGANGRARLEWSWPGAPAATLSDTIRRISRAYWDKGNRPATPGEISTWVNEFMRQTTWDLNTLFNNINPQRCNGATTDNCGTAFPVFR